MSGGQSARLGAAVLSLTILVASCSPGDDDAAAPSPTSVSDVEPTTSAAAAEGTPTTLPAATVPAATTPPIAAVAPEPDDTPLPIDADLRTGILENGLTYYARSNPRPGRRVDLRLVVDAGSFAEATPGSGIAHYVEHMLFNGTERFPGNELDHVLASIGAEIGPDLNAYTSRDETVYRLTVPTDDPAQVDLGFDVVEQWASAATFDENEVEAERGVVREELRVRRQRPSGAVLDLFDDVYYSVSSLAGRDPVGDADLMMAVTAEDLRAFYDRWYRPDNMAVVAVGDLPVDRLEREIVDRFSALEARAEAVPPPDTTVAPMTEPIVRTLHAEGHDSSFASIDYTVPSWASDTVGGERLQHIEAMAAAMLQNRIDEGIASGVLELERGSARFFSDSRTWRALGFNVQGADLLTATSAVLDEMAAVRGFGFTAAELDRVRVVFQAGTDRLVAEIGTRQDGAWADLYVADFLSGVDVSAPDEMNERASELIGAIGLDEVNGHMAWLLDRVAPLVVVVSPDADLLPGEDDLRAAIESADAGTGAGRDDAAALDVAALDALMAPPDPVEETGRRRLERLSLEEQPGTVLTFDNGVTVVFAESTIATDDVSLSASGSGGWSLLPPGSGATVDIATRAVDLSGVGDIDRVSLQRFLAGSFADVDPWIGEAGEGFTGRASSDHVELMFQLLHLMVTAPRVDEPALRRALREAEEGVRQAAEDPATAAFDRVGELRYSGDDAFRGLPSDEELTGFTAEAALELYRSRLGTVDDMVVAVAGDVALARVVELARTYLGTLPAGPADEAVDVAPAPPDGPVRDAFELGADGRSGVVVMSFEGHTVATPTDTVALEVLENVLRDRLFESLREELGATYGATVTTAFGSMPRVRAVVNTSVSGDPERLDEIEGTMTAELAEIAASGPLPVELEHARAVAIQDAELVDNAELLELLRREIVEPDLQLTRSAQLDGLARLSATDVRDLAAELVDPRRRITVVVSPSG